MIQLLIHADEYGTGTLVSSCRASLYVQLRWEAEYEYDMCSLKECKIIIPLLASTMFEETACDALAM